MQQRILVGDLERLLYDVFGMHGNDGVGDPERDLLVVGDQDLEREKVPVAGALD